MKRQTHMTAREAREYLGISPKTLARLIKEGTLTAEDDPLDKRLKLVKRSDVEALAERSVKNVA